MFTQEKNRFYLGDPVHPTAEIVFEQIGEDTLSVSHTFVDESLRGQGIAEKLLDAVADHARNGHKKLSATCSYARKKLDGSEKYRDIAVQE